MSTFLELRVKEMVINVKKGYIVFYSSGVLEFKKMHLVLHCLFQVMN